jgi:hypothetical protein
MLPLPELPRRSQPDRDLAEPAELEPAHRMQGVQPELAQPGFETVKKHRLFFRQLDDCLP